MVNRVRFVVVAAGVGFAALPAYGQVRLRRSDPGMPGRNDPASFSVNPAMLPAACHACWLARHVSGTAREPNVPTTN